MGNAAIGLNGESDQNWLPNAVKRRGAVSPAIARDGDERAGDDPWKAVRSTTLSDVRHFVYPSASAASRIEIGNDANHLLRRRASRAESSSPRGRVPPANAEIMPERPDKQTARRRSRGRSTAIR